jgi:hypothetical protein
MVSRIVFLVLAVALGCCMAEFTAKDMHSLARLGQFDVNAPGDIVYSVSQWVC